MTVTLNAEVRRFVEEQIAVGRFASVDQLLDEAVRLMMIDSEPLDDQTVAAIQRAEAQLDSGDGVDFDRFAAEMRKRITAA